MTDYRHGDVLISTATQLRTRYIRVSETPRDDHATIYVQDCDGAGFLLGGIGRNWGRDLLKATLDSRYRLHYRPEEHA